MADIKITDLTPVTQLNANDLVPCVSGMSGTPATTSINIGDLRTVIGTGNTQISGASHDALPSSGNVIGFPNGVTGIAVGNIMKLSHQGAIRYFLVTAVGSSSITLSGPTLSTASTVSNLEVLAQQRAVIADIVMSGAYCIGGATTSLINRETKSKFRWNAARAYLVYVNARNNTADSVAAPTINITRAQAANLSSASDVLSSPLTVSGTSWNSAAAGTIRSSYYEFNFGDELEIDLVSAGSDGDARDMTVTVVFALEF